jgi:Flp pilus assembly protein TadG
LIKSAQKFQARAFNCAVEEGADIMISQKGQAIVEFVFVLPLFLFFMFVIIYSGMVFADYISLNDVARSCAREAAITSGSNYTDIYKNYDEKNLAAGLYTWDSNNHSGNDSSVGFSITDNSNKNTKKTTDKTSYVKVIINAKLKSENGSLVQTFKNFLGNDTLFDIHIEYKMYKEA